MEESKLFQFLCTNCRAKEPVFVRGEFHIYCMHNRLTVIQGQDKNVVRYDSEARSPQHPKFDGTGGYFRRGMKNDS
jgi:hypothetical protein